jgi:hypothetical protein
MYAKFEAEIEKLNQRVAQQACERPAELDFGHKDGNFLVFSLRLRQPDGERVKTFLIGKMNERQIVGTFVDDVGITGEWTAVRVSNSPKS